MVFVVECIVLCILFNLMIMIPLAKNPVGQIMSYPVKIRRRVESLPQYQDMIQHTERKHLMVKVIAVFVIGAFCAAISYISGAHTVKNVFLYTFGLFFVVNLYDLFVMDLGIFMHCKKFWIPGTEDMVKEYHDPTHHIVGAVKGTVIGVGAAIIASGITYVAMLI